MKSLAEIEDRINLLQELLESHEKWVRDILKQQDFDRGFFGKDCILEKGELTVAQEAVKSVLAEIDCLRWVIK